MTMKNDMTVLTDVALITCIIQRGMADAVVAAARAVGAQGATVHFARGTGIRERLGMLSITVEAEKEVIQIVVSSQQQEEVFTAMFVAGKLGTPGMGIMYVTPLDRAATFIPKEILDQIESRQA